MLLILPISAFIVIATIYLGIHEDHDDARTDWRGSLLMASLFWGGILVALCELLSVFHALTQIWLAALWASVLIGVTIWGWRSGSLPKGWSRIGRIWTSIGWLEGAALTALGAILVTLIVIALHSPPNNTDSLQYHMSRVVHWAQNQGLQHYPTGFEPQLMNPIWAEMAILNLRILWGNDQLAGLVQWFSLVGSLVGVSALAKLLGARRWGQMAAAAFVISLPMGILQATSTQNDLVVAFWYICLAYFVVLQLKRDLSRGETISLGLAVGLGMLTKGTFYPYAVPFILVYGITLFVRRRRIKSIFTVGAVITIIIVLTNLGYWTRNLMTYGGPLGSTGWVERMTARQQGALPVLTTVSKNTLLNFVTPYDYLNEYLVRKLKTVLGPAGQNLDGFHLIWGWNHEDLAGNPLHAILVFLTLVILLIANKRIPDRAVLILAGASLAAYIMLAVVVKFDQYGVRYQTAFWISWAPVFGVALSMIGERWLAPLTLVLLIVAATPWVLFNRSRPLIAMLPKNEPLTVHCKYPFGCTSVGSVLREPASSILFANWMPLRDPYMAMTQVLQSSGCQKIGLRIDSHDPEYLFWWLLEAPQSGVQIETIYFDPNLARYANPTFKPCAVICTICEGRARLHGLELTGSFGNANLYQGDGYRRDPDQ